MPAIDYTDEAHESAHQAFGRIQDYAVRVQLTGGEQFDATMGDVAHTKDGFLNVHFRVPNWEGHDWPFITAAEVTYDLYEDVSKVTVY